MHLPNEFTAGMEKLLGGEYEAFIESYSQKPKQGIRANPLKTTTDEFKTMFGADSVAWCPEGLYINPDFRPGKSPLYHTGMFYIQEPSAMTPVSAFDIQPGHKVLDLCAAPGGKSVHAAGKLNGAGLLISNDVSASRAKPLVKNIELAGIKNAVVLNEPPEKLAGAFPGFFDRIIADAPCSGEGMFRKDPDAAKSWVKHASAYCASLQRGILSNAAKMLAPGGKIMYSTCTFAPEENELMIIEFLEKNSDFEPCAIDTAALGISPGLSEFRNHPAYKCFGRIWPHRQNGEGHFLACVKKSDSAPAGQGIKPHAYPAVKDINVFFDFCKEHLYFTPQGNFTQYGTTLYMQPPGLPSLERIRVAMGGLRLGDIKSGRFEPAQAFAMSLRLSDSRNYVDFSDKSHEAIRYLKGESFEVEANNGYVLVGINGLPVGWGKVLDSRMKNKYSRSWLMA